MTLPTLPRSSSAAIPNTAASMQLLLRNFLDPGGQGKCAPWLEDGGWNFAIAPASGARRCPAFWRPDVAASVVVLAAGAPCLHELPGLVNRRVVAEQRDVAGYHCVLDGRRARHRLRLIDTDAAGVASEFRIRADRLVSERLVSLAAFSLGTRGDNDRKPTPYRRYRLVCLLAVLDLAEGCGPDNSLYRQIAAGIFPGNAPQGRAMEWKNSSERRQTQRLLAEARRMMAKGYRDLLAGRGS